MSHSSKAWLLQTMGVQGLLPGLTDQHIFDQQAESQVRKDRVEICINLESGLHSVLKKACTSRLMFAPASRSSTSDLPRRAAEHVPSRTAGKACKPASGARRGLVCTQAETHETNQSCLIRGRLPKANSHVYDFKLLLSPLM